MYIHRDTTLKLNQPWFIHGGLDRKKAEQVTIADRNADPMGTGTAPYVACFYSFEKPAEPGTPGYLDSDLGIPVLDQFWFLGTPYYPIAVDQIGTDGTFSTTFKVPTGLAGQTLCFEAYVQEPVTGLERLT